MIKNTNCLKSNIIRRLFLYQTKKRVPLSIWGASLYVIAIKGACVWPEWIIPEPISINIFPYRHGKTFLGRGGRSLMVRRPQAVASANQQATACPPRMNEGGMASAQRGMASGQRG